MRLIPDTDHDVAHRLLDTAQVHVRATTSLEGYAREVVGVEPALHHRMICDAIDRLFNDEYDDLIILCPPGSAKSTYVTLAASAYFMGRFPDRKILACSHTFELAEMWGRRVRNLVDSPQHRRYFPNSVLSKDSTAAGKWTTTEQGEFRAAGAGGAILGLRADAVVLDDIISGFEQAQSITQLEKLHNWFETDLITRLKPGGKIVQVCQRLARNDLAGYMMDRNEERQTRRQRVLKFKMVAEEDDPLGRQPGERLWPEWFTEQMVEDARRDDYKFRTLYMQEPPSDSGDWVSADEIRIVDIVPEVGTAPHYLLTDLALSVNKGDYSVHLAVAVDSQKNCYVVDAWRERTSPDKTAQKQLEMIQTYEPTECLIDDDNASKLYMQLLSNMARDQNIPVPWRPMPIRGQDKETRAAPLRGMFKRGKIFIKRAAWNAWLVGELLKFPNALGSGVDDGVDALSLLGRRLSALVGAAPAPAAKPPVKTWQDMTLNEMFEDRELKRGMRGRV